MLGAIAVLPIAAPKFWHSNRNKLYISLALSLPVFIWMPLAGELVELEHTLLFDYVPFIFLLGSLFIITAGIRIQINRRANAWINTILLATGAVLASIIGTTGASMLLIRPLLDLNLRRKRKVHTVLFFIAIAANCGGLLTPIGDPPLFLLHLRGVPFFWFMKMLPEWFVINLTLLAVYFVYDFWTWKKKEEYEYINYHRTRPFRISGWGNVGLLILAVLTIAFVNEHNIPFLGTNPYFAFAREIILGALALISLKTTSAEIRIENRIDWDPIYEVAYLFFGIFATMAPALLYLREVAPTLGINSTGKYYFFTGALSSFLDNTPTAATFYSVALGALPGHGRDLIAGVPEHFLLAISLGAVLFGSLTYIGNGPNFMIKSIAENEGVPMPQFFEYMYKFSLIFLLPLFILVGIYVLGI